jgi:hypothetical protein
MSATAADVTALFSNGNVMKTLETETLVPIVVRPAPRVIPLDHCQSISRQSATKSITSMAWRNPICSGSSPTLAQAYCIPEAANGLSFSAIRYSCSWVNRLGALYFANSSADSCAFWLASCARALASATFWSEICCRSLPIVSAFLPNLISPYTPAAIARFAAIRNVVSYQGRSGVEKCHAAYASIINAATINHADQFSLSEYHSKSALNSFSVLATGGFPGYYRHRRTRGRRRSGISILILVASLVLTIMLAWR